MILGFSPWGNSPLEIKLMRGPLASRQPPDPFRLGRPLQSQLRITPAPVIRKVKPRRNSTPQQRHLTVTNQPRPLPNPGGNHQLHMLPSRKIRSKSKKRGAPVREKLQHLNRIAIIKVENLI